jgi:ketosteroid isomerase-like protein/chorismate-pyruvate lyase
VTAGTASVAAAFGVVAALCAQAPSPRPATIAPLEALASVQTLSADILASRSATATLENWCRDHRLAEEPQVVAHLVTGARKTPSSEQLRRLEVTSERDVIYRRVRLQCGTHVLSDADNWYVPARLTAEMNRLLQTTDTPFGKAVAPLAPSRQTLSVRLLWSDSALPIPESLFEHRAVLYTRDHQPFSEVAEVYRRDLLDFPSSAGTDVTQHDIRSARIAQNDAIAAGDLDRAAAFWTDDVTVRRALGQALSGRAAAREALEPAAPPAPRIVYQRLTRDVDSSVQWPLAFETGTWEGHLGTVTGPTIVAGRFSAQWIKRNDRWLIRSEVFVALTCSGIGCRSLAVP